MKGGLRQDEPHREGAARQALAIGAVARVDQLRSFGDLVADLAALAAAALGKFHRDVLFMWPLLVPVRLTPMVFVGNIGNRDTANRPKAAHRVADRQKGIRVYVGR